MAEVPAASDYKALLTYALETIKKLTSKRASLAYQPIAVLGMGCRLPGGCTDPDAFWEFLRAGGDGVIEVPKDRWDAQELYAPEPAPNKSYVKEGGFIQEDVRQFDARFFGISPREANEMDPQQRMLLEVCWEALERAGIAPGSIKGSRTGIFIGQIGSDYALLPRTQSAGNPYTMTGFLPNMTAGRLSYVLGIHGPSLAIDTACSSSLVAAHLACESLNRGECELAVAGGVNLMLSPAGFSMLCEMGALSRDGRCKMFSANGDGYGRGEGIGAVVLKRLADAQRDHDPILAVIKGSSVNQDGPGSGLTVPNGSAQQVLLREALERAGLKPAQISYFESHGTGTSLGDPIEYDALCHVFGNDAARSSPLMVGSVKSNIAHLEGAAGIAGLIKLVLCLQNREIPPNLHLDEVNPKIQLNRLPAVVPQALTPWRDDSGPLTSAISSFGFSGTNANMILAEAPLAPIAKASEVNEERPEHVLTLSCKNSNALKELAARYDQLLASDKHQLADICFTANTGRNHFAHRLAVTAGERHLLRDRLAARTAMLDEEDSKPGRSTPKIVFLANGTGDWALAVHLFHTQPAFNKAARECDEILCELTGKGIIESWMGGSVFDPAVDAFCLQYCLLQMWSCWGVRPRAILGTGAGELISACAAGVMELRTALTLLLTGFLKSGETLRNAQLRMYSAAGRQVSKSDMRDASYWARIATTTTPLEDGVSGLLSQGYDTFVCLGPKEGSEGVAERLADVGARCAQFLSATPWSDLASGVATLYEAGVEIDWVGFDRGYARSRVLLPTYPFQRKRFWSELALDGNATPDVQPAPVPVANALEARLIDVPIKEKLVAFSLPLNAAPDIRDTHGVLHVGYFMELLSRAIQRVFPGSQFTINQLTFVSALILRENSENAITLTFDQKSNQELAFVVHSQGEKYTWHPHAQGTLRLEPSRLSAAGEHSQETIISRKQRLTRYQNGADFYDSLAKSRRLELGQGVRWIADVWSNEYEALARFETPPSNETSNDFVIGMHPGIFDACAQLFHAALPAEVDDDLKFMVTGWTEIELMEQQNPLELWCHVTVDHFDQDTMELHGGFELLNEAGHIVARVETAIMKGISATREEALKQLVGASSDRPQAITDSEILRQLRNAEPDDRSSILEDFVKQCFSSLLEMERDELDLDEKLGDIGMDSMVALSARKQLETELGIQIPVALLIEGPSLRELAVAILPMISVAFCSSRKEIPQGEFPENVKDKDNTSWIALRKPNEAAKVKLFCLPYGGAGASVFRGWQALLPSEVEVCPIQLPGKESRIQEQPFEDLNDCIDALYEALSPELDRPCAFYGHSVGGLIAYRLAFRLHQEHENKPFHLFVGGYSSPTVYPNPIIQQTQQRFLEANYKNIPAPGDLETASDAQQNEIFTVLTADAGFVDERNSPEIAKVLLSSFLADLKLVQSFVWDGVRFDLPLTVFHGLQDQWVKKEDMMAWQATTSGPFKCHLVSGGHLFISEDRDLQLVTSYINQCLSDFLQ